MMRAWWVLGALLVSSGVRAEVKDLYVARHGQTAWNAAGRVQGDPDLDAKGYEDRVSLFLALREAPIEAIFTSSLLRTRRTAELIARHRGVSPRALTELDEMDAGVLVGICHETLQPGLPQAAGEGCRPPGEATATGPAADYLRAVWAQRSADKAHFRPPLGESYTDGRQRVRRFVRRWGGVLARQAVLVVAHQGTNRLLLAELMSWPLEAVTALPQHNDWIFRLQISPKGERSLRLFREGQWRPCAVQLPPDGALDCVTSP